MTKPLFMEVVERGFTNPSWITTIILFSLLLLVLLRMMNSHKFLGTLSSITNKGFLEIESEEKQSAFTFFNIVFTLFSLITLTLSVFFSLEKIKGETFHFREFSYLILFVGVYMLSRFLLELVLIRLLSIQHFLNFFFESKKTYLFSISIGVWFLNVIYFYSNYSIWMVWVGFFILFSIRFFTIIITNKNLIFSHLFYFILYLCAFEIAPLLILYKMITK